MKHRKTIQLIQRYLEGKASTEEVARVDKWYEAETNIKTMTVPDKEAIREQLYQRILAELGAVPKVVPLYKRSLFRVAAAASIILMLGIGSYFFFFNRPPKQNDIAKTETPKDVEAPKGTKAMITLADGKTIELDSVGSGTLAIEGNVNVIKTADGKIVYNGSAKEVVYNTLTNPRGSKVINMTLADGSRVWLNTGSSVTYPVAFVGKERKVSITGEAYFEVTHNAAMPFKVSKGETAVQVLGTHFNVNAYDDESAIRITLLEGSVKVSKAGAENNLVPGQQAQVAIGIKIINDADIEAVMAWKNEYFRFANSSLQELMRQIARWYDVDIIYEGQIADRKFGGKISRNSNLSDVLKILEESKVHFRMEEKRIVVMP